MASRPTWTPEQQRMVELVTQYLKASHPDLGNARNISVTSWTDDVSFDQRHDRYTLTWESWKDGVWKTFEEEITVENFGDFLHAWQGESEPEPSEWKFDSF